MRRRILTTDKTMEKTIYNPIKLYTQGIIKIKPDFIAIIVLITLEILFFRNIILNSNLFGDCGDGRLTMLLTEHWFRFFTGKEKFADLAMFYPYKGTLGLSDMFLGFGIPHSFFRFLGFDMHTSFKIVFILVHLFGSFSMYYLLRRKLKTNITWSLFGVIAFLQSTTYANQAAGHPQLNCFAILPFLSIFFVNIIQNFSNRKTRNRNCYIFIFTYIMIIYTAWYVAFFTAVFFLILLTVFLCKEKALKKNLFKKTQFVLSTLSFDLIKFTLFTLILFIPFILVYIPILRESGGYTWDGTFSYIPEIADILNVGKDNLLLGNLISKLGIAEYGTLDEGISFILFILFIRALCVFAKKNRSNARIYIMHAITLSCVIGFFFVIKLRTPGVSLWYFIWRFIPGGKSIRTAERFLFFLSFPISISVSVYGDCWQKECKSRFSAIISFIMLPFLLLTQIRAGGVLSKWNSDEQKVFLASIPSPPSECKAFFVTDSRKSSNSPTVYMMDAYEIATHKNVPTMNGYSGSTPAEWNLFDISHENYPLAVDYIVMKKQLKGIYGFDLATKTWYPHAFSPILMMKERMQKFDGRNIKGGHDRDGTRFLEPAGTCWGPYWTVLPGKYKVVMTGSNLDCLQVKIYSHLGDLHYPFTYTAESTRAAFDFEIPEIVQDFELFSENRSDRTVSITSWTLIRQEDEQK